MVPFEVRRQNEVRDSHSATLDAGFIYEAQLGFRASYGFHFYVG